MSLYGAMFSGVSGLIAQGQALGMISDNISNVNTVGYKTTKASFSTLVTGRATRTYSPGGVRSAPVAEIDRAGLIQSSTNDTAIAISGDGFFVASDSSNPAVAETRFFTRAGDFYPDAQGYLVSPAGYYLQGWPADPAGEPIPLITSTLASLSPVRVSAASGAAVPTSFVEISANLPAQGTVVGDQFVNNVQIFDSLGVAQDLTFTWTQSAVPDTWDLVIAAADAGAVVERGPGPYPSGTPVGTFNVVFNGDGTPLSFNGVPGDTLPPIGISNWTDGALTSDLTVNLGTSGVVGAAIGDGMTRSGSEYSVGFINQNGVQFGNFIGVNLNEEGIVTALYDNGETLSIFRLPIATFPNPNGLQGRSGTVFTQTREAGDFILRRAGEANAGKIVPNALEGSATDLATEFTRMIITQRAYSASARVISTADQMLEELIRVGR